MNEDRSVHYEVDWVKSEVNRQSENDNYVIFYSFEQLNVNGFYMQLTAEKKTPFLVQLEKFWPFSFCGGFKNILTRLIQKSPSFG